MRSSRWDSHRVASTAGKSDRRALVPSCYWNGLPDTVVGACASNTGANDSTMVPGSWHLPSPPQELSDALPADAGRPSAPCRASDTRTRGTRDRPALGPVPTPDSAAALPDWPGVRLHVVTGKGDTGKSTVADSLVTTPAPTGLRLP